ncbi:transposase [Clostridium sp. D2Q-11]|uniref:Transposase n=1 Tax=Anaeromonas frigoriresistens TaxID=2683708 RepID=A0A942UPV0_9FIRM|nr:transposase [Anaeromonas frigoriresistens]MBS4536988.1 transposase [Anaeromonas frigoriresistens]
MIVKDNGIPRKVQVFCAKLSSEKAEFIHAYPRQSSEFFFDGLNKAVVFFGGIPRKFIFDNLTQTVKEVEKGNDRILQDEFCGPAKGNEKVLVENLVKYTGNNYFLPYLDFKGFNELNNWLLNKCWNRLQTKKNVRL